MWPIVGFVAGFVVGVVSVFAAVLVQVAGLQDMSDE